jgi:tetratricopeptide (TPR) repeat protein
LGEDIRRAIALAALCAAAFAATAATAAAQELRGRQEPRPGRQGIEPGGGAPGSAGGPVAAVSLAYRSALSRLAAGSAADAVEAVAALERRTAADAGVPARAAERGVTAVLDGIAGRDPEALLPAILLHVELFRRHREARDLARTDDHAAMVERAAALYAQGVGTPAARAAAAEALAAVGLALLEDQRRTSARRLLMRGLEIDPDNVSILLGLASDRERYADYPEAVALLERLVAVAPDSEEGRLRLAINLRRTGRRRDAAERLTALTRDPAASWAAEIAYQELARTRLAEDDAAGAAALLREGLGRFPESERLRLQLAFALDRGGDPAAARRMVAELARRPPAAPAAGTSRLRYNRSPEAEPALALAALRERADQRLPQLAAALDALAYAEGAP